MADDMVSADQVDNQSLAVMMMHFSIGRRCLYRIGEVPLIPEQPIHVQLQSLDSKKTLRVVDALWFDE